MWKSENGDDGGRVVADAIKFESTTSTVSEEDETDTLLNLLYAVNSVGGTPLRQALYEVGSYFDQTDGVTHATLGNSPYDTQANGGHCQMTFAIAMTDGYWNGPLGSNNRLATRTAPADARTERSAPASPPGATAIPTPWPM